jgi:2-amino-4-hydroxy-6-hydroxymethyldihydropteridine diphosphokinase
VGGAAKARLLRHAGCAGAEIEPVSAPGEFAFVALGSNLGDAAGNILEAIGQLEAFAVGPLLRSSLWQTAPVDCPPGSPAFVNAVVAFPPVLRETPESLLKKLQALERAFGRRPKMVHNEARPLDLDLIAFRAELRNDGKLILPHPRAHLRRFVLQPLAEIAPELVLPGQKKTVRELLGGLPFEPGMRKVSAAL